MVTPVVTLFLQALSRSAAAAIELLGTAFGGIVVSDCFSAHNNLPTQQRQLCWAHVIRDLTAGVPQSSPQRPCLTAPAPPELTPAPAESSRNAAEPEPCELRTATFRRPWISPPSLNARAPPPSSEWSYWTCRNSCLPLWYRYKNGTID